MYYSSISMLAIILHLIINADHLFGSPNVRRVKVAAAYRYFLFTVLIYYISDALWGVLLDSGIIPMVYADNYGAAVAYGGRDYRVFTMGFPFECIKSESMQAAFMQGILNYLIK